MTGVVHAVSRTAIGTQLAETVAARLVSTDLPTGKPLEPPPDSHPVAQFARALKPRLIRTATIARHVLAKRLPPTSGEDCAIQPLSLLAGSCSAARPTVDEWVQAFGALRVGDNVIVRHAAAIMVPVRKP